jgi:hypothetical protein
MADVSLKEQKKETEGLLDAIKELTKAVTELAERFKNMEKEWEKWRKAGKF